MATNSTSNKTATKSTTPVKKAVGKTTAPPLDFKSLSVTDAPAPTRQSAVSMEDNPFTPYIKQSWEGKTATGSGTYRGKGKQVEVPTANEVQVTNLIRKAAMQYGASIGERIGAATQTKSSDKAGYVVIAFCAKTAKQPRKKTADNA